jgi:hypothetical protein
MTGAPKAWKKDEYPVVNGIVSVIQYKKISGGNTP